MGIGTVLDVYGRDFLIFDADAKCGLPDWTLIDIGSNVHSPKAQRKVAPYNGWGDEEDSIGYCLSLHPKPPRTDVPKLVTRQGQMLRFSAVFKNPAPQDRFRKFVIVFDLSDDTVAVFELPQPNSGFREGKFIQRDRIRNYLAGNGNFVASNFRAGDEMTLNGFTFLTTNADEYAKTLMEAQCSSYPQADLAEVFVDLKRDKHAVAAVRTAMEPFDKLENSSVDPAAAPQVITRLFGIPQHEAMTAVRRWTNDWGFDYYAFGTHLTA